MFNIIEIVKRDNASYYNYRTKVQISRKPIIIAFCIISILLAILTGVPSNDFLSGALSAQSILVGFSFNVLFYLAANRLVNPLHFKSIEHELRFSRLLKLSDEIFDNVSYFNVVAVASVFLCLILLLTDSESFGVSVQIFGSHLPEFLKLNDSILYWIENGARVVTSASLLFALMESLLTFVRAVGRVGFYFSLLKIMNDDNIV